ncbi:hypothetical protein S40285_10917 [Stachybotrys chlorohalonatus IBT 40285]|uniref:Uncharacterized protein n=1 Tax=Stachybotrys chlorohalonatus (strain IBT 40285) TaxID=1283841 RepID=A0A084QRK5_STAC4|nr:hypothetical protein S40285_10917 [Stachybotrys chlorohalonata IBT 40285]
MVALIEGPYGRELDLDSYGLRRASLGPKRSSYIGK